MVVVAVPTALVAVLLAERFTILDDATANGGRPRFSDADQLRINEIDEGFNRALRLGDTVFTLSGLGWWLVVGVLVLLTTFVFVVVPGKFGRRSPGQSLLSVSATDAEDTAETVAIVTEPAAADWLTNQTGAEETAVKDTDADESVDDTADSAPETAESADTPVEADEAEPGPEQAVSDELDLPEALSAAESLATTPVTLADSSEYLDWDRQEHAPNLTGNTRDKAGSFNALTLTESSLAESPLNASTVQAATVQTATVQTAGTATATATAIATAESPIWSDMWKAWLYWDPASDRWFRHDTSDNSWKPLT